MQPNAPGRLDNLLANAAGHCAVRGRCLPCTVAPPPAYVDPCRPSAPMLDTTWWIAYAPIHGSSCKHSCQPLRSSFKETDLMAVHQSASHTLYTRASCQTGCRAQSKLAPC